MQFARSQYVVFQFSGIGHNGFAFLIAKPIVLMSKSNESFADVHQLLDFFLHVHIQGHHSITK